jgi:hypothetical protein
MDESLEVLGNNVRLHFIAQDPEVFADPCNKEFSL